ncbi:unnamed protein product [Heligmosomoides polygyrus]|uniref:F0F1 ATP synthase subunit A n=1 Tax=Heligmosomoides polygyrus TaxID=6339 RepID=A0A183G445_HELPZ|nr:unnamed protein product [Heligmosomoides polygyrus]
MTFDLEDTLFEFVPYVGTGIENMIAFAFCPVAVEIGFDFCSLLTVFFANVFNGIGDVRVRYLNGLLFV